MKTKKIIEYFLLATLMFNVSCKEEDIITEPTCSDGIQNGSEIGLDCGGPLCSTCFSCGDNMTDIDGNIYSTVSVGTQCWMRENLQVSRYNDGLTIPSFLSNTIWATTTNGAYTIYDDYALNNIVYGKLYNWHAVNTNKLCPTGWHIPSHEEWTVLAEYLGGEETAGGKMKSMSSLWKAPNTNANNESGLYCLPGGFRLANGTISNTIEFFGYWWSSNENDANTGIIRVLSYNAGDFPLAYTNKQGGYSCRCIKD